uniref:OTU domain-containing protein n=1 Tax=viral metagenome TaxID=1070528 RepID=A0A6C0B464_9ZZZZ
MVKSGLRPSDINYEEVKKIDDEDVGVESTLYEYEITPNFAINIALGKEKYTYSKREIIYFPIYLVVDDKPKCRIGVFEIDSNQFINILDEDNDVMLEKGNILLFEFVNEEYVKKFMNEATKKIEPEQLVEDDEVEELEINDEMDVMRLRLPKQNLSNEELKKPISKGVFTIDKMQKTPTNLVEENGEISEELKKQYNESSKNNWIERFMKNNNYDIIDNEGGGDCFFAVIRDAFHQIGHQTTVQKLRDILADQATDEIYMQYRTLYVNYFTEIQLKLKEMKDIKKTIAEMKKRNESAKDKKESAKIIEEVKEINKRFQRSKLEKEDTEELMVEFEHMATIDTFDKFKEFIRTASYWADTWAISTLERLLNIKVIILSKDAFEHGDLDSVLQCGQLNDSHLEQQGNFKPDFYVMTCYLGNHYQLISYKHKRIFKFNEIPYDIKVLVINKCIEKNAGPYYLIQDFRNLKTRIGLSPDEGAPTEDDEEYLVDDLYEPETQFMFYSKSAGNAKAGKGSGEKIVESKMTEFNFLNKDPSCKDWRRKLDDSWIAPFQLDNHRWSSVEHYYQAAQFKKGHPDFYVQFSLDSGTDISKDIILARAAGSKSGKLKDRILRPKNVKFDADFIESDLIMRNVEERNTALEAKFMQNADLKKLLAETKKAKLVHFVRSEQPTTDDALMKIRGKILSPHNGESF